ncbi:MAG: hypothetical protein IT450_10575 [Phycisphaerales bacterium]|nr:hypothetical protein [Phycisphaerales bacterium]
MQAAMEFMKTHMISLICGVVGLVAIVGAALGWTGNAEVVTKMQGVIQQTSATSIGSLRSSPKNDQIIEAEKEKTRAAEIDFKASKEIVSGTNRRELILPSAFPKPDKDATAFNFKEEYKQALGRLAGKMLAEGLPTEADIQDQMQLVDDLKAAEAEQKREEKAEGSESATPDAPAAPVAPVDSPRGAIMPEGGGGGRFGAGGGRFPVMPGGEMGIRGGGGGMDMTSTEPRFNPLLRANVEKAKSIRCYVDPGTFHRAPLADQTEKPAVDQMWYAQVGLWVQDDVATAIRNLNETAARATGDASEAYVEHMPVKRLISVRVQGYVKADGKLLPFPSSSATGAGQEEPMEKSFTQRKSDDLFDIVRFSVTAVVDQRQVLQFIEAINRVNYYRLLSIGYDSVDRSVDEAAGYLYGTAPVVRVKMEFEGYMLREVFDPWKPKEVLAAITGQPNE